MGERVVVVGDALLDADLTGRASRLAPDAPVPVLDELHEARRPGGAALAALLVARDGLDVVLVTALADDDEGRELVGMVRDAGVRVVVVSRAGTTPLKRRVRSGGQSLLRLDSGEDGPVGDVPAGAVEVLDEAAAVLVSDYGRGLLSDPRLRTALEGVARRAPVVWDPHPRGGVPVAGARLVTPNETEAAAFAGDGGTGLAAISRHAAALVAEWRVHAVAVTLGPRGALVTHGESSPSVVPAPRIPSGDTCGAGDRFASAAVSALTRGAVVGEAVHHAVHAASDFVAAGAASGMAGAADPRPAGGADLVARVRAAGGTVVATGGCFDLLHAGHIATLEAARALGDCLVVCLNSDASVRRLKGPTRPLVTAADRTRVLDALEPVDAVLVFDEDTPVEVLRSLRPDIWAKGGDYAGAELPEAKLLRAWGGQSVVLPYLEGRSTTGLVTAAASR
jgi:D-beta-D-heptose 7-phosphate kinase/D-beta-D-heptose 1-phosphate adenosyltransferase